MPSAWHVAFHLAVELFRTGRFLQEGDPCSQSEVNKGTPKVLLCCVDTLEKWHTSAPMNSTFLRLAAAVYLFQLAGCASLVSGDRQELTVNVTCKGQDFPSYCRASNAKGIWDFYTPETKIIKRDASPLWITCDNASIGTYASNHQAQINPVAFGNIIAGGMVGVAVDRAKDALWQYQQTISVEHELCKIFSD